MLDFVINVIPCIVLKGFEMECEGTFWYQFTLYAVVHVTIHFTLNNHSVLNINLHNY